MLKTKVFRVTNLDDLELEINQWLKNNQNIDIVSVNSPVGNSWAYIILYKE
jgi:hypothetical protein